MVETDKCSIEEIFYNKVDVGQYHVEVQILTGQQSIV